MNRLDYLIQQSHQGSWTNPWVRILKRLIWDLTKPHHHGRCWVCGKRAHVRHHILPLSRGGFIWWPNTVQLDKACHAKIHPWLKR